MIGNFKPNANTGKYTLVLPKAKQHYIFKAKDESIRFENNRLEIPDNFSFYLLQRPLELDVIGVVK